jgi:hypothetical protein
MEKQNLTISLPKVLLKKAKALAAKRETSLNQLIRKTLEDEVGEATGYGRARERQLRLLDDGLDMGSRGRVSASRGELHARR